MLGLHIKIPLNLKRLIDQYASAKGVTVRELLTAIIMEWIAAHAEDISRSIGPAIWDTIEQELDK